MTSYRSSSYNLIMRNRHHFLCVKIDSYACIQQYILVITHGSKYSNIMLSGMLSTYVIINITLEC